MPRVRRPAPGRGNSSVSSDAVAACVAAEANAPAFLNVPFAAGKKPAEHCDGSPNRLLIAPVGGGYAGIPAQRNGFAHSRGGGEESESESGDEG